MTEAEADAVEAGIERLPPSQTSRIAYSRLTAYLAKECFHPGELVGSERELAARFDVTRNSLRQALAVLEADGVLQRHLGRTGGVFKSDSRIQRHLNTILGVPEMVRRQGMTLRTAVLRVELGICAADERRALRLRAGDRVIRITRLRNVDGCPWSLDSSVVPVVRFPGLDGLDLSGSLYELMHGRYSIELDHADEMLSVVGADTAQAPLLGVEPGAPVLSIWRTAYAIGEGPIEFAHDYFRADRTRVHMQKFGTNWKRTVRTARASDQSA